MRGGECEGRYLLRSRVGIKNHGQSQEGKRPTSIPRRLPSGVLGGISHLDATHQLLKAHSSSRPCPLSKRAHTPLSLRLQLCEGLQVDERSITDWAAAVMPSDEATVLHKGLGCPVPGRRKTVGLVYRKRQRVWCVQLWFRSRTHTLYWMPYSNFIVAGRARDRIVLHLR